MLQFAQTAQAGQYKSKTMPTQTMAQTAQTPGANGTDDINGTKSTDN